MFITGGGKGHGGGNEEAGKIKIFKIMLFKKLLIHETYKFLKILKKYKKKGITWCIINSPNIFKFSLFSILKEMAKVLAKEVEREKVKWLLF